ncbi:MAG: hypothetical protein N2Z22_03845 [Turneriella sp.]|nr:hypothetical protein [Turneriella sp.]
MRIDTLFIEEAALQWPSADQIQQKLRPQKTVIVHDHQEIFSRKKKPYLAKRHERDAIVAVKRGSLVKEAPPAYGFGQDARHYYFVHAYNCIYECEYCYLQGYFSSPDLVFFVNHSEVMAEMARVMKEQPSPVWFHAGEFSDSLALSHISGELPLYWDFFAQHPQAFLELRTKSVNLSVLRHLPPLPNTIVSFSLSGQRQAEHFDHGTPPVPRRLQAMAKLARLGFRLAVHFDPIIFAPDFAQDLEQVIIALRDSVGFTNIDYVSVGVVRFARDVFRRLEENYPDSPILARHFIPAHDGKMRYIRPLRLFILETAISLLKKYGYPEQKIYLCME